MDKDTQISAYVPRATNERLDLYVRETGITKGRAIADAIESYLDVHEEIPADAVIPTRMVLDAESGERFVRMLTDDAEPPSALGELMARVRGRA